MKKPRFPLIGAVSVLFLILIGCTQPDFRTFSNPVMTTEAMEAELIRLHALNLTVPNGGVDISRYPMLMGVDSRNGKMLVEKFICWDSCPDVGMVFLMYQNVESAKACAEAVVGTPMFSPASIGEDYWGCRPVVDWLDRPDRYPG